MARHGSAWLSMAQHRTAQATAAFICLATQHGSMEVGSGLGAWSMEAAWIEGCVISQAQRHGLKGAWSARPSREGGRPIRAGDRTVNSSQAQGMQQSGRLYVALWAQGLAHEGLGFRRRV